MPKSTATTELPSGVWTLVDDGLAVIEPWAVGPAIVLVPTEYVLLLAVDLPPGSASQRRAALPFAIEDRIAEPLDAVHVALGTALSAKTWLAAVVGHPVMAAWVAILAEAGLGHASLVPDALLLPVPEPGAWTVMALGDRVVGRTETGGFAIAAERFAALAAAAGSPPCTVVNAPLALNAVDADPPELDPAASGRDTLDLGALVRPAIDLRAGPYAGLVVALPRVWRRATAVVATGLLAYTAILAADARGLTVEAAHRRTATESLLRATLPGTPLSADVERLLPGAERRRLVPLLARAAAALDPVGGLSWTRLAWSAADNSLTLGVEAGDIGGLQRAQAALAAAGLSPSSGAVTTAAGRAAGEIVVRGREA